MDLSMVGHSLEQHTFLTISVSFESNNSLLVLIKHLNFAFAFALEVGFWVCLPRRIKSFIQVWFFKKAKGPDNDVERGGLVSARRLLFSFLPMQHRINCSDLWDCLAAGK